MHTRGNERIVSALRSNQIYIELGCVPLYRECTVNRFNEKLQNNFASIFVVSNTKKNYEKKAFLNTYIIVLIVNVIKCNKQIQIQRYAHIHTHNRTYIHTNMQIPKKQLNRLCVCLLNLL